MIPHPEKAHRGGEDAFFSHRYGICVADGVGGYASSGVDPAIFTRRVAQGGFEFVDANPFSSALATLNAGVKSAQRLDGGCPATLATIIGPKRASVLNLGDCGILVLRDGETMYRTTEQQHYFNCPFQLPGDHPAAGLKAELDIYENDVFIAASDGVWDNVEDSAIIKIIQQAVCKKLTAPSTSAEGRARDDLHARKWMCKEAAEEVSRLAATVGASKKAVSPFSVKAKKEGYAFAGGKQDDVTVLVAVVQREGAALEEEAKATCPSLFDMKMILAFKPPTA